MRKNEPESGSLYDLYRTLGLSADQLNPKSQFTIHKPAAFCPKIAPPIFLP